MNIVVKIIRILQIIEFINISPNELALWALYMRRKIEYILKSG